MLADVGLSKGRYVTQRHIPSAGVSDPEPRHHLTQLCGQTRKLMAGRADLMGARSRLQRQVADVDDVAINFADNLRLLFSSTGDDHVALGNLIDRLGDVGQRLAGAGSFDGGVQGLQVGLLGNRADHPTNAITQKP